jgi:hypothetical protein
MDYSVMTIYELKELCKERRIRGYGGKNKDSLIQLLGGDVSTMLLKPISELSEVNAHQEPNTDHGKLCDEVQADPVEPSNDPFEASGPFTYIFERSSHIEPLEPVPTESFWKVLEVVDTTRPHFLVLENVNSLVRYANGTVYNELKAQLLKRGYFHRYRILDTLEKNVRLFVVCLRRGEEYSEASYHREKVEEARISVIINPTVNTKYTYSSESSSWSMKRHPKSSTNYSYIRFHVSKNMSDKQGPPLANSSDLTLRQCFNFANFPSEKLTDPTF